MSFQNKLAILCIATGLTVADISLAEEISSTVSLSSLVQHVYQQDPAHHNEFAQQQQINANTDLANAFFADTSSVNLDHQNDAVGSDDGLQEWEGSVDMPLWLSGQKQQQLSLSDKMSAELPAYKQQIRLDACATVRELVWNVVLAENTSRQAYQIWQTARELKQDVAARVKAGDLAGTERLLANTNALEMRSHYVLAQAELDYALRNYQNITGENTLPQVYQESLSAKNTIDQQHPSLMMLDQKINTLRALQDLAHFDGAVHPSLSLGIHRERDDHDDKFNNSVVLGISFALDGDVYRRPAIANAAKELADAQIARQQLATELDAKLFNQSHNLKTKQQQLKLINEQEKTTQQYLSLQQRAFDLGEIDLVSLLRSQTLANKTQNRKNTLEIEIKHTIAKVNQALGLIL